MLGTKRTPLEVTTTDPCADMLLCAGQILYMSGHSDNVDPDELNKIAGRPWGQVDAHAGALQILLRQGFRRHSFGDSDLRRAIWQYWPDQAPLLEPHILPLSHRREYQRRLPFMQALKALGQDYARQLTRTSMAATVAHLDGFLSAGSYCVVELAHRTPGWPVAALVYGQTDDTYRMYHPLHGIMEVGVDVLRPTGHIDFVTWGLTN